MRNPNMQKSPMETICCNCDGMGQQGQEPVAWYEHNQDVDAWFLAYTKNPNPAVKCRPLVFGDAAPVQPVEQQGLLTKDDVRKAGGIVHGDGNIFFTNIDQLNAAIATATKEQTCQQDGTTDSAKTMTESSEHGLQAGLAQGKNSGVQS